MWVTVGGRERGTRARLSINHHASRGECRIQIRRLTDTCEGHMREIIGLSMVGPIPGRHTRRKRILGNRVREAACQLERDRGRCHEFLPPTFALRPETY